MCYVSNAFNVRSICVIYYRLNTFNFKTKICYRLHFFYFYAKLYDREVVCNDCNPLNLMIKVFYRLNIFYFKTRYAVNQRAPHFLLIFFKDKHNITVIPYVLFCFVTFIIYKLIGL